MPIEITMPALSPTMTEGNLANWLKKEGDEVSPGDVIAEIETDKATMEVEAVEEGVLGKILVKAGSKNVKVNEVIALLLAEGEDKKALADYKPAKKEVPAQQDSESSSEDNKEDQGQSSAPAASGNAGSAVGFTAPPVVPIANDSSTRKKKTSVVASPLARRMAADAGIVLERLTGTGPQGRIVKADVETAIKSGITSGRGGVIVRADQEQSLAENDNMRQVIATRLLQAKQHVPHFYLTIECNIDKLLDLRKDLNDSAPMVDGKPAYKISVNDMVIKASALAMKDVPEVNASWTQDVMVKYNNIDISVAVAIDGGLITPIVKNADQHSLPSISNTMKTLAGKARAGTLAPEEFQGGGFSISNLGMYGIKEFKAIINPPQSAIMAVGAGEQRAVVVDGELVIATMMNISLSCDHRVVDGAVGATFLKAFKEYIERPIGLVV